MFGDLLTKLLRPVAGFTPISFEGGEMLALPSETKAAICVSADFELGWAWRNLPKEQAEKKASAARANFPFLLDLLSQHRFPITWATVGHLFLSECARNTEGFAHASMVRPLTNGILGEDWYARDPCSNLASNPLWYAPDLIKQILDNNPRHELATHSFSHIDFGVKYCYRELVKHELDASILAMNGFGVRPHSIVFPHNVMGDRFSDMLWRMGIIAMRFRGANYELNAPHKHPDGPYKIYETMHLGVKRPWLHFLKARLLITKAIQSSGVFHLWFHPSIQSPVLYGPFSSIVRYCASLRDSGAVWIATMRELAAYTEARATTEIRGESYSGGMNVMFQSSFDQERFGPSEFTILLRSEKPPRTVEFTSESQASLPIIFSWRARKKSFTVSVPAITGNLRIAY